MRLKYDWLDEDRVGVRSDTETLLNTNGLVNPQINFGTAFIFGSQLLVPVEILSANNDVFYRIGRIRSLYDEAGYETANRINFTLKVHRNGTLSYITFHWVLIGISKIFTKVI
ncbi:MAG: hypothetical protein IPK77_11310 [Cellvibrio sp.]|nr:hypothetical protein [Cellvibrio sp.]